MLYSGKSKAAWLQNKPVINAFAGKLTPQGKKSQELTATMHAKKNA